MSRLTDVSQSQDNSTRSLKFSLLEVGENNEVDNDFKKKKKRYIILNGDQKIIIQSE